MCWTILISSSVGAVTTSCCLPHDISTVLHVVDCKPQILTTIDERAAHGAVYLAEADVRPASEMYRSYTSSPQPRSPKAMCGVREPPSCARTRARCRVSGQAPPPWRQRCRPTGLT